MSTTIKTAAFVTILAALAFFAIGVAQASAQVVQNGSFEDPGVTDNANWEVHVTSNVPGWTIEWMDPTAVNGKPSDANLEFHRGVNNWAPSDGDQYVELDTDWDGPGGGINGEAASVRIFQEVETEENCAYDLTFSFSPRPGTGSDNNVLGVVWNGSDVDQLSVDGTNNSNTDWTEYTYQVSGTGLDTLAFEDRGTGDSLGTFLDDVRIEKGECTVESSSRGDDSVRNSNSAVVINETEASASTGGNYAGGSYGGDGGNGGDIENDGDDQDVDDSDTGRGGNGGNAGQGGYIETGNANASASTVNSLNSNVTRINRCACSGDDKGDVTVRSRNRAFLLNETDADARTGGNAAAGSHGGDAGNGGDIENDDGDDQDVDDSSTGVGGNGGQGGTGGAVFTGRADAHSVTINDINRNTTRIRR